MSTLYHRSISIGPGALRKVAVFLLAGVFWLAGGSLAQAPASTAEAPASAAPAPAPSIDARDIPARADADEVLVQAITRRSQVGDKLRRFDQTLAEQSAALTRLSELTESSDMTLLSVRRQESLERHWRLNERAITQTRAEVARATNVSSEDAAELTRQRTAWQATRADADLAPALAQRADELIDKIDRAQAALGVTLSKLLDLGRKSNMLVTRVQGGLAKVVSTVEEQDRRLLTMDTPPLWSVGREQESLEPVTAGLRRHLDVEAAFARDYDASHARIMPALVAGTLLLLPLLFWLRRRARQLVSTGQAGENAMQALSRPWAAWLLLVAVGAVLYDMQGPILRQQTVMLLAWIPLLALLQRRILSAFGPWAYLSAVFYFFNFVASLLVGDQLLYRIILLIINLLMLAFLSWPTLGASAAQAGGHPALQTRPWIMLRWTLRGVLVIAVVANTLGNISLAAMLTVAILDSSYVALAMYAGAKVVVALFQVLFTGARLPRFAARHSATLVPAAVKLGQMVMVVAWLVFALQSFRVYGPLSALLMEVLTREFKLGELSLSLGSLVAFAAATWLAFWLARTIRLVLSEDILPRLALPIGVGGSISALSYYSILFLGLLAALAASGFQVGQLTIIFGALGVGIGIGLQDVVRNFVSGLIILFERPIRRGDTVDVAGMSGVVSEIGLRATIVTTFEGAEVVVPNGMLLADKMVTWTLSGTRRRIDINVSTGYDTSPQRTMELLAGIAASVDGISMVPAPAAIMTGLSPGALEFNLRAWTKEGTDWLGLRSTLAAKVTDGLAEAGIQVPRPQRDIHLHGPAPVPGDGASASQPATRP